MNLLQFIRLILRNLVTIIIVPIVIAITIFFSTKNSPDSFKSSTTLYTGFASGYSIENGEKAKIDFHAITISFDNLINIVKAKDTKEEIALRLLAHHIFLNKKADKTIWQTNLDRLSSIIPSDVTNKVLDKKSEEKTFTNLVTFKSQDEKNVIYTLLNHDNDPYYSIAAISDVKMTRMESSDMVKLEFESNDPGICQNILNITTEVIIRKFRGIKQGETNDVSAFFELQTKLALERLNAAEENLKNFRTENRVINYYEQTKFISEKREDLIDELNKEKMTLASAEAAMTNSEEKLGASKKILKTSADILNTRNKIVELNSKLIILQNEEGKNNASEIGKLGLEINQLKNELDDKVTNLFGESNSKEGITHKELAKIWIDNAVIADESKSRLPIYTNRLNEIEGTYDLYAPLGSNLNKMERQIGIAEKEYLNHLASLSAARLREQNLTMSSNLQVIDPAFFPTIPLPNSRKLLVVGGAFAGLVFIIAIFIMLELLDQTISSPERAISLIKRTVISGFPLIGKKTQFLVDNGTIEKMVGVTVSKIYQYLREKPKNEKPFVLSFISTRGKEGKTFFVNKISEYFKAADKKVLVLLPENEQHKQAQLSDVVYYPVGPKYIEIESISQLLPETMKLEDYDIVLIEFLNFFDQKSPIGLANACDLSILVTKADRLWENSDSNVLNYYTETFTKSIFVILNSMPWYNMEYFIGEVLQKRSKVRQLVKKWIKLDFSK
jgi:succinoglycan biosynthesis transport protein ExoP